MTAFLGYKRSPKWYKLNNNNIFDNNSFNDKNRNNGLLIGRIFSKINFRKGKRYYSTLPPLDPFVPKVYSKRLKEFLIEKNLNPIYSYEDIEKDYIKKKLKLETKNLSGIYLILNKVTLDFYIGSASTGKFYSRFSNHLFNFSGSNVIKNAVKKYKISAFAFLVLELFPEVVTKENNKNLLNLEDFYLKSLLPNYNILTEAGSSFGYKHTEITRLKMKANYSEERRIAIGNLNKGKNLSEETINIMKEKALIRKRPNYSEQALANMRKRAKPLLVYNLDNTIYGKYSSITEAAKSLDCSIKTIRRVLNNSNNLLKKRWIVKLV